MSVLTRDKFLNFIVDAIKNYLFLSHFILSYSNTVQWDVFDCTGDGLVVKCIPGGGVGCYLWRRSCYEQ